MKAIVYTRYGSPDVLELKEVAKPVPGDHEVRVKVQAAAINAADQDYLNGTFLIRLGGFQKPKYTIPGSDIAGKVEAVGSGVTQFKPGDEVSGDLSEYGFGAFAEYVCVPENILVLKPANLTFEQAAAAPTASVIALQGLRNKRAIQPGQKVLINGAGGGVGTFAVQLARHFGAEVTGVDSTGKLDLLRSMGVDYVMDYTREDFTRSGKQYDLILDMAAYRSISDYNRALCPDGIYTMVGGSLKAILQAAWKGSSLARTENHQIGILMARQSTPDLTLIKELLEAGTIKPMIDLYYPFRETAEAFRYFATGQVRGKVVITME